MYCNGTQIVIAENHNVYFANEKQKKTGDFNLICFGSVKNGIFIIPPKSSNKAHNDISFLSVKRDMNTDTNMLFQFVLFQFR